MADHAGQLAILSLVFLILCAALEFLSVLFVMVRLDAPIGQPGVVSWKIIVPEAVARALPATILITLFLRTVAKPAAPRGLRVVAPFYVSVFWRVLVLSLLIGAGGAWLNAIGYYDPDRPDWPTAWEIAAGYILAVGSILLALRLSPALAAAAVGQPAGLTKAWRRLSGQFLGFLVVFLGVLMPLYALSYFIGGIIFSISIMIEEHLFFLLIPAFEALGVLPKILAITAVLAVTELDATPR